MKAVSNFSFLLLFLLIPIAGIGQNNAPIYHKSHYPKKADAPFSDVVEVGNTFYLAGQIGMDHNTRTMVEGGIIAETEQAIANIAEVLKLHGLTLDDVVKCTVILSTMDDFKTFNSVYTKHFTHRPARTTFAASGLARDAKVEIEVVAYKSE